jgi:deoxyribose-phosphate aldolase
MSDPISREELARMIDHSLLKPTITRADTIAGIEVALKHNVAAVTIQPRYVKLAADRLAGSTVKVNPVVCFPLGYDTTETKVAETREMIEQGAQEIDMVLNIGALIGGEDDYVRDDIAAVVEAAADAIVKVIFEIAYLNEEQIVRACHLTEQAGAHFVKTSSGFAPSGYTLEALRLMRANVSPKVQVKAAHGVRTLEDALVVRAVGVTRFGATQTEAIMAAWERVYGGVSEPHA